MLAQRQLDAALRSAYIYIYIYICIYVQRERERERDLSICCRPGAGRRRLGCVKLRRAMSCHIMLHIIWLLHIVYYIMLHSIILYTISY